MIRFTYLLSGLPQGEKVVIPNKVPPDQSLAASALLLTRQFHHSCVAVQSLLYSFRVGVL